MSWLQWLSCVCLVLITAVVSAWAIVAPIKPRERERWLNEVPTRYLICIAGACGILGCITGPFQIPMWVSMVCAGVIFIATSVRVVRIGRWW